MSYYGQLRQVNRILYELTIGPIPDGYVLDITCNRPECILPMHMDPVPRGEKSTRYWKKQAERELEDAAFEPPARVYINPNTGLPF